VAPLYKQTFVDLCQTKAGLNMLSKYTCKFFVQSVNGSGAIEFTRFRCKSLRDRDLWPHDLENAIGVTWIWRQANV